MNKDFFNRAMFLIISLFVLSPLCAEEIKMKFGQDGVGNDKKYYRFSFDLIYKSDCEELEKACAKFFFDDSVSISLEAAVNQYLSQFPESKKIQSEPDVSCMFTARQISNVPGRYTCYLLSRTKLTTEGKIQKKKTATWNLVYDTQNDRLLTIDDIFVPNEAARIKETVGNRRAQLAIDKDKVVWGYLKKGELVQQTVAYFQNPDYFTESFQRLIGSRAFDRKASFVSAATIEEYLHDHVKYPAEAAKNLDTGFLYVDFAIDVDGCAKDAKFTGINRPSLEAEVLRVLKDMRWKPAIRNGEAVKSMSSLTVHFPTVEANIDGVLQQIYSKFNSNLMSLIKTGEKVNFQCVVEADGSITNARAQGASNSKINQEITRLAKTAPKGIPAKLYDVPVRSSATSTVTFSREGKTVIMRVMGPIVISAPVIKKDPEVLASNKGEQTVTPQSTNTSSGEVLKAKEVVAAPGVPQEGEQKVFDVVEQMPSFPGGPSGLMEYLSAHIVYPPVAEENGVQGRVICTFVVERDGSITDVRVVKSVDPALDKESIRVLKSMPRWIPGKQNNSAVRVKYTVPVTFRLTVKKH